MTSLRGTLKRLMSARLRASRDRALSGRKNGQKLLIMTKNCFFALLTNSVEALRARPLEAKSALVTAT